MKRVSDVHTPKLQPGTRVGDHLIIQSVLGAGGTAVVFEALHTRLNANVAVKVVVVDSAFAEHAAHRLEREASTCAAMSDEHIPKVFDTGRLDDGTPYIVMEKVQGPTLESLLEDGPLSVSLACAITRDLLCALEAVHTAQIVHRDVKPANLIVQRSARDGVRVRLMDFGVSKPISPGVADPTITQAGAIIGTPHYMAPEQVSDHGVDGRADLYSVGVCLYEMLAGRPPFEGRSSAEVMTAVLRHRFDPLHHASRKVPPSLSAFVARAMAESPLHRFASAREMREELENCVVFTHRSATTSRHGRGGLALPSMAVPRPEPQRAAWAILVMALAFGSALVAHVDGWSPNLVRRGTPEPGAAGPARVPAELPPNPSPEASPPLSTRPKAEVTQPPATPVLPPSEPAQAAPAPPAPRASPDESAESDAGASEEDEAARQRRERRARRREATAATEAVPQQPFEVRDYVRELDQLMGQEGDAGPRRTLPENPFPE